MDNSLDNPFYKNYLFSSSDLRRIQLHWFDKLRVIFRPMYVQLMDDYIVYFKTTADGRIFLFKMVKSNNEIKHTS